MPSFQTTVNVEVDVDFEVFCARCGAGLCNQSDTRASRNRKYPQVTVEPCERCLENAAEEARQKAMEEAEQPATPQVSSCNYPCNRVYLERCSKVKVCPIYK